MTGIHFFYWFMQFILTAYLPWTRHCSRHWGNGSVLVIYCQVTNHYRLSGFQRYTLITSSFLRSGVWAWLQWVPCSESLNLQSMASTEISYKNLIRAGSLVWFLAELGSLSAIYWGPQLLAAHLLEVTSGSLVHGPAQHGNIPTWQHLSSKPVREGGVW